MSTPFFPSSQPPMMTVIKHPRGLPELSSDVSATYYRPGRPGSEPYVALAVRVQDDVIRQQRHGFDGFEKVYAWLPTQDPVTGSVQRVPHPLGYTGSDGWAERHIATIAMDASSLNLARQEGILFSIDTNVGHYPLQPNGQAVPLLDAVPAPRV